jgi:invasion protein IalB
MSKFTLLFAALLAAGTTLAHAQEQQLPLTVGVPEGAQPGQPYVKEVSGDWTIRCMVAEEGKDEPCQLYQLLKDKDGNNVAELRIFGVPDNQQILAGGTISTPLETLLTPGLRMAVDDATPKVYPFTYCAPGGCVARIGLTPEDIDAFKAGNAATIALVPLAAPNGQVLLNVSLAGFTKAYDAVIAK